MPYVYLPPITRDDTFACSGIADSDFKARAPKESEYHARADPSRLYSLLTYVAPEGPALTKKGTARVHQPPKHKDPPVHFYRAQCIHYGIKPFATKPAAKKNLLAAFGSGKTLDVPANLLALRQEMQDEWAAARKVADAQERQQREAEDRAREERKRKEDREREEKNKRDAAFFAAIVGDPTSGASSKKRKATSSEPAPATKKNKATKKLSSEDTAAQYRVVAPYLSTEWPFATRGEMWLKMCPSRRTGHHLWMSFDFGAVSGTMRGSAPPKQTHAACSFTWRGTSQAGEGELLFGKGNVGSITFLGDGKIRGTMRGGGLGDYEFAGERVDKTNVAWVMSVAGWKSKYRAINGNSYDRQGAARWGKWVSYDGCDNPPDASDSSANDASRSSDEDDNSDMDSDVEEVPRAPRTATTARKQLAMKPQVAQKPKAGQKLTRKDTEGKFNVSSPYLSENWSDYASEDMWLKVAHSKTGGHVWISFDFGVVSGVMRGSAPPKESTTVCTFTWHGHEQGEGEMTFTEENTGTITFLGGGKLRGTISGSFLGDDVVFTGQMVDTPNTVWVMSVPRWKAKYRRINFAAHERAAVARWGKWVADRDDADPPEDSDSDAGAARRRRSDSDDDAFDDGYDDDARDDYDQSGGEDSYDGPNYAF